MSRFRVCFDLTQPAGKSAANEVREENKNNLKMYIVTSQSAGCAISQDAHAIMKRAKMRVQWNTGACTFKSTRVQSPTIVYERKKAFYRMNITTSPLRGVEFIFKGKIRMKVLTAYITPWFYVFSPVLIRLLTTLMIREIFIITSARVGSKSVERGK